MDPMQRNPAHLRHQPSLVIDPGVSPNVDMERPPVPKVYYERIRHHGIVQPVRLRADEPGKRSVVLRVGGEEVILSLSAARTLSEALRVASDEREQAVCCCLATSEPH